MGRKLEFDFTPFTHDQIREMSEEDLYKNINYFKRMIREATRIGKETQSLEVEFCYLDHERIMRDRSRQASEKFYKSRRPTERPGRRPPGRQERRPNNASNQRSA